MHYSDVTMGSMASQIASLTIVYSAVYSGADQIKHQSSASLAFVRGIHRGPVNFPHKWPVTRKMFSFDDVIMAWLSRFTVMDRTKLIFGLLRAIGNMYAFDTKRSHIGRKHSTEYIFITITQRTAQLHRFVLAVPCETPHYTSYRQTRYDIRIWASEYTCD